MAAYSRNRSFGRTIPISIGNSDMDRRQFFRLTGVTTLGVAVAGCAADSEYESQSLARPELLVALGAGSVRAIGERYRALNGAENDGDALRTALRASRPFWARIGRSSPPIATLVREDFGHGRTVLIDGWILSVTEARQCALFSLLSA